MMKFLSAVSMLFFLMLGLTACEHEHDDSAKEKIAVIDFDAVMKATGQDVVINKEMEAVNADLTKQLQQVVVNLNKQLAEQKNRFGPSITPDQQQQLQEMLLKANQQLQKSETVANQKSLQHKEGLILGWRKEIQPVVQSIAEKNGASLVLTQGPQLAWFDAAIDITDEVMAELRANPIKSQSSSSVKKVDEDKDKEPIPVGSGDVI